MKFIAAMFVVLMLCVGVPRVQGEEMKKGQTAVTLTVRGMMCASCQKSVENALSKLEGVTGVKVDMKKNLVGVTYDAQKVTPRQMVEVIEKAGFRAQLPTH